MQSTRTQCSQINIKENKKKHLRIFLKIKLKKLESKRFLNIYDLKCAFDEEIGSMIINIT